MSIAPRRNTSYMNLKSVSEADESIMRQLLRAPYVQVTIVALWHLEELQQGNLEPYIVLTHGESRHETKVLTPDEEVMQTFEIDIIPMTPLVMLVMDKDDYGKHSMISSVVIPENNFGLWIGRQQDVYIRIEPSDLSENEDPSPQVYTLSDDMLLTDGERFVQPHIHVRILVMDEDTLSHLRVEFKEHSIRSTAAETYTQYMVEVIRGDGMKWITSLRYSQVNTLRKSLASLFPEFRYVSFPSKTYLDCFSSFCSNFSRFNESRIEERKKGLEAFINIVLQKPRYFSDPLMEMLQAYTPARGPGD